MFKRFIKMLKDMSLNTPLIEELEQIPGQARFMKELVTKKRAASFEDVGGLHHCIGVTSKSLDQNMVILVCSRSHVLQRHPNSPEHYVTWEPNQFDSTGCIQIVGLKPSRYDYYAVINVDHIVKKHVGITFDVFVKVKNFIFQLILSF